MPRPSGALHSAAWTGSSPRSDGHHLGGALLHITLRGCEGRDRHHPTRALTTSVLAIVALLAGRFLGLEWLDPTAGLLGALVILKWGVDLCRGAAFELLDIEPSSWLEDRIREQLEAIDDVRVADLHVWSLGQGMRSCVVTVITAAPREVGHYRDQLSTLGIAHLTIEVRRCTEGHEVTRALLSHDQRGTLT
jgi:hypothetical protein